MVKYLVDQGHTVFILYRRACAAACLGALEQCSYDLLTGYEPAGLPPSELAAPRHRLHAWALVVPFVSFPLLNLFHWNPIYPAIIAMALGAITTLFCRPDLAPKIGVGAILFAGFYAVFLLGLEWTTPSGNIERVWNLPALSGQWSQVCRSRNSCSPPPLAPTGRASTSTSPGTKPLVVPDMRPNALSEQDDCSEAKNPK